ncbi:MAG: ABC transporter permease [Ectothiorhodospira sp.]
MDSRYTIPTQDAHSGLVVAEDVIDRNGRLLIPAGSILQEKHLRVLKTWGIAQLRVRGAGTEDDPLPPPAPETGSTESTEARARAEAVLREVFRHTDPGRAPMDTLFRLAVERLSRRMERP